MPLKYPIVSTYPSLNNPKRYKELVDRLAGETKGVIRLYFVCCSEVICQSTYLKHDYVKQKCLEEGYDDWGPTGEDIDKTKTEKKFLEALDSIKGTKELIEKLNTGYQALNSKSEELGNDSTKKKLEETLLKINQFEDIHKTIQEKMITLIGDDVAYWC
jgi:hypothetical protein